MPIWGRTTPHSTIVRSGRTRSRVSSELRRLGDEIEKFLDDASMEGMTLRVLIRRKRISNFLMLHACFTPIALCFVYTSQNFYAFSGTNLLMRCHSASYCFLLFLCFKKVTQEIFSELDKTKAGVPIYLTRRRSPKERRRGAEGSRTIGWRGPPLAAPLGGVDPWSTP
jgi:hypothetical protein